jgi:hypothetical protein
MPSGASIAYWPSLLSLRTIESAAPLPERPWEHHDGEMVKRFSL